MGTFLTKLYQFFPFLNKILTTSPKVLKPEISLCVKKRKQMICKVFKKRKTESNYWVLIKTTKWAVKKKEKQQDCSYQCEALKVRTAF